MAIVRLGQLSAESVFDGEFISEEQGDDSSRISADGFTGTYAYESGIDEGPMGLGFPPVSQIRAGYWLKHEYGSTTTSGYLPLFRVRGDGSTDVNLIGWNQNKDNIDMVVAGSIVDSITSSSAKFLKPGIWQHLGMHIKAGVSGFFSFYLNGLRILTYSGSLGADFVACFHMGIATSGQTWLLDTFADDFFVDSTVGEVDGPAPALRFFPSFPVGSGNDHEWLAVGESDTYQCVKNVPLIETELAFADAAALRDTHLMVNVASLQGQQVHAVIPYVICRKTRPEIDSTILVHLFDGLLYQQSGELSPGVGLSVLWNRQTTQPDASAWDETAVNAMEMGYESSGDYV